MPNYCRTFEMHSIKKKKEKKKSKMHFVRLNVIEIGYGLI